MRKLFVAMLMSLLCLCIVSIAFAAASELQKPSPGHYVLDEANLYTDAQENKLNSLCGIMAKNGKAVLYIVTVPTLEDEDIADFAGAVADKWKPGDKDKDNGLVLVIAEKEHKVRLEVGRGLEEQVTDSDAGKVLDKMTPSFKKNDYFSGTKNGIEYLDGLIKPENETQKEKTEDTADLGFMDFVLAGIAVVMAFGLGALISKNP